MLLKLVTFQEHHLAKMIGRFRAVDEEAAEILCDCSCQQFIERLLNRNASFLAIESGPKVLGMVAFSKTTAERVYIPSFIATRDFPNTATSFVVQARALLRRLEPEFDELFQYVPVHHYDDRRFAGCVGFSEVGEYELGKSSKLVRISYAGLVPNAVDPASPYRVSDFYCM